MLKKIIITLILFFIPLFYSNIVYAQDLKIVSTGLLQGKHFLIEFIDTADKTFYSEFNGKKSEIIELKSENKSRYISFFGIPADIKPGEYEIKISDSENNEILNKKIIIKEGKFSSQYLSFYKKKLTKEQEEILKTEEQMIKNAKNTFSKEILWNSSFIFPVPHKISSFYGIKRYINGKYESYHSGVDFLSPGGYPIKAINNGKIILARYFSKFNDNGNTVFIDHGGGVTSVCLHLSKIIVKEGSVVKKGDIIGYVGSTGRSTGPHLHWGVYINGQNTDGISWVKFSKNLTL